METLVPVTNNLETKKQNKNFSKYSGELRSLNLSFLTIADVVDMLRMTSYCVSIPIS